MASEKRLIDANALIECYSGGENMKSMVEAIYDEIWIDRLRNAPTALRWIPVAEKLPDLIPCGAGTAYSEAVNILTTGRKVMTAIWDGTDFIADAEFWEAEGEEITHWTPVLLPLPEHPKKEG